MDSMCAKEVTLVFHIGLKCVLGFLVGIFEEVLGDGKVQSACLGSYPRDLKLKVFLLELFVDEVNAANAIVSAQVP